MRIKQTSRGVVFAGFGGIIEPEANLRRANLMDANLWGASLWMADLSGADLMGANLEGADLMGANLVGADLRGADLRGANLREAILSNVNLEGADLRRTSLWWEDIQADKTRIGCQCHPNKKWKTVYDEEVNTWDKNALIWWRQNRELVLKRIEEAEGEANG